ncbi:MaoC family dehydratase [Nitrincola tapanii]|uniref:MaoC family dehydratase n=1 Tax=Nitrincola tapanii TaxID=1708751 RepID=A0A5A9W4M5_9GAMM|nr:MaoC family dehydratase [Nitrincola tapanii]KAA0875095.1 MaoC family dehydratase [Nitrincola tapanii]
MQEIHGYYLEDLSVGLSASYEKTLTDEDVRQFASLSGDHNPVHLNDDYAKTTLFGQRIVHGMFSAALISTVAGMHLPGPGAIYIDQQLKFKAPVFIGDTAKAVVTVMEIDERRRRVKAQTDVFVGEKLVATGEATFMVDKRGG